MFDFIHTYKSFYSFNMTIIGAYSGTTPTEATQQNSPQIWRIKIVEVNNSFQQIILVIKLYITKATELWSFWIFFWKIVVNLHDI